MYCIIPCRYVPIWQRLLRVSLGYDTVGCAVHTMQMHTEPYGLAAF